VKAGSFEFLKFILLIVLCHITTNIMAQNREAHSDVRIIALVTEPFQAALSCRLGKPVTTKMINELIEALDAVEQDPTLVKQYTEYYTRFRFFSITHNEAIVRKNLAETRSRLLQIRTDIAGDIKETVDICTAWISCKSSFVFPGFWFHLDYRTMNDLALSTEYIEHISSKSQYLSDLDLFQYSDQEGVDSITLQHLTGISDPELLDNHFVQVTHEQASDILEGIAGLHFSLDTDLQMEHKIFCEILQGVVNNKITLILNYSN
jgi:hypothetical protein